ncbi:inositol monophosphatase family protein [Castellaniella sp. S9]|uniref:inositol monophosphatase family protein n=1 Tax=Castellaniella sp. S9 TaxID=2993652 RepID=UPI0022B4E30A|nr:inositol monophosphatase family protein [Castellaniella sp. S9]
MQASHFLSADCMDAAVTAAHAAAAILQTHALHRADLVIDFKMRNDLVSQADREAERAIVDILSQRTPDIGIIAEESGGRRGAQATWYVDPLDGTTNFLSGIPHYAVSIALVGHAGATVSGPDPLTHDTPLIGVVYDPNREELFSAMLGIGAWSNGRRIQCSGTENLSDSVLATGFPFRDFSFEHQYMPTLREAMGATRGVRRLGSAALDLAWTACGRYDGYWEMGLSPWDVAAGVALVRAAGGVCEDIHHRQPWPEGGYVYAANPQVADALDAMIAKHL